MPSGVYERFKGDQEIIDYIQQHASADLTRSEMRKMILQHFGIEVSKDWVKHKYLKYDLPSLPKYSPNRLLTDEQAEYMISIIPGKYSDEVATIMNKKYGLELTSAQVRGWKKNHQSPSGIDTRYRNGRKCPIKGKKWAEWMPEKSQANSRKTQYQKGNIPANHAPVGTIVTRADYKWIKIQDRHGRHNWMLLHRFMWEYVHGKVPDNCRIMFRDGNPMNCRLRNLALVKKKL